MLSCCCFVLVPVSGQELQAGMAGGMSAECPEPGPGGPQGQCLGPGRQCPPPITPAPWSLPRWRAYVAAAMLCYINLLNYMNWFIIAGEEGTATLGSTCCSARQPGAADPQWPSSHHPSFCSRPCLWCSPL